MKASSITPSRRFSSPPATAAEVSGDASQVSRQQVDDRLVVAIRLDGRAQVRAR